ncbi:MAG: hypothetical protein AAF270_02195 [Pseudomonadota bacterium]
MYRKVWWVLAVTFIGGLAAAMTYAQDDTPETQTESTAAESSQAEVDETQAEPTVDEDLSAEDAAVQEVLSEAELIYRENDGDEDFIPTEQASADQSLDYPIDI